MPVETGHTSQMVLEVESLPSNTRLYKVVAKDHLVIQCSVPTVGSGERRGLIWPRSLHLSVNTLHPSTVARSLKAPSIHWLSY